MGTAQSVIEKNGYTLVKDKLEQGFLVRSSDGELFIIKKIKQAKKAAFESFEKLNHPHIVGYKKTFEGDDGCSYVVLEHCGGGDLSQKIKDQRGSGTPFSEQQILDWVVKICLALKYLHDKRILHRNLQPKDILFTDCGTVCLREPGDFTESFKLKAAGPANDDGVINIAPEIYTSYDEKSEIWHLGCIIHELSTLEPYHAACPSPPNGLSSELCDLIEKCHDKDSRNRPSTQYILRTPFIFRFLSKRCIQTSGELSECLKKLNTLADGLEGLHYGTTIGSLTGGVMGAAGGITSIVGLILAPFTLGASLIVTGVGVGVAAAGGATAGISNITNMVNQSTDRQTIKNIVREFQEKMNSLVAFLQCISEGLEDAGIQINQETPQLPGAGDVVRAGARVGRGLTAIPELVRLVNVASIGRVLAQASRAVRVAEVATGVFSAFFIALDVFFIAMDAKEIHNIRQAGVGGSSDGSSDSPAQATRSKSKADIKSETMKFVLRVRETAAQLQDGVDELQDIVSFIPNITDEVQEVRSSGIKNNEAVE